MSLKDRLRFDALAGAVYDGGRRYVLMRPDVLMGIVRMLDPVTRDRVLEAWRGAAREGGGQSLRAYLSAAVGDVSGLVETTVAAAADLGWGRWQISRGGEAWRLTVFDSPFAQGAGRCDAAVCAPIAGLFAALVETVTGGACGEAREGRCVAQGHSQCDFVILHSGTES